MNIGFNVCEAVMPGTCVVLDKEGTSLFYAGPIRGAPKDVGGGRFIVLLSVADFERLKLLSDTRPNTGGSGALN